MNRPQDEHRLDEMVRNLASDYNAPARDLDEDRRAALFARIQDERRGRARPRTIAPRLRRLRWAAALVAVLVIGFALGRWQPQGAVRNPGPGLGERSGPVATNTAPAHGIYQYAARNFLERSDNLLLMLQRDAGERPDEELPTADWAQTLLRETRLLQDSPATKDDPQLAELLEDLELLLAQIVQATRSEFEESPATDAELLQRIRGEIERNNLMNEI